MKWTNEYCPYGEEAYVDENRRGHWGGPDFPVGSLITKQGVVTVHLRHGAVSVEEHCVGSVDPYSYSNTEELYRKARRLVEDHVRRVLGHA